MSRGGAGVPILCFPRPRQQALEVAVPSEAKQEPHVGPQLAHPGWAGAGCSVPRPPGPGGGFCGSGSGAEKGPGPTPATPRLDRASEVEGPQAL